jgi:hypothetical protein
MVKVELNRLPKALAWLTDRSKLVRSQLHLMAKKNGQAKTLGTTLVALANKPRTVQLRLFATLLRSSTAMVKKTTKIVEKLAQAKSAIKLLWSHRHVHGVVGLSTNGHLYIRNELRFDIYVNDKRIERHAKVPIKTTDVIVLGVKGARLNLETQTDDHAAGEAQAARVYVNGIELNAGNELPIGGIFHNRKTIIPAARKFGLFYWNVKRSVKHGKVARALPEELIEEAQVIEDERFARHLDFAAKAWFKWRSDSLDLVFKYGPKLADEQLVLEFDMYEPVESIVALFRAIQEGQEALDNGDQGTASALNMLCAVLKADLQGKKHTTPEIKAAVKETFDHIMAGTFRPMAGVPVAEICLDYLDEDDASLEAAA